MNYVIYNNCGDTTVTPMSDDDLEESLKSGWLSNFDGEILVDVPYNTDTNTWGENILIIRGTIYEGNQ